MQQRAEQGGERGVLAEMHLDFAIARCKAIRDVLLLRYGRTWKQYGAKLCAINLWDTGSVLERNSLLFEWFGKKHLEQVSSDELTGLRPKRIHVRATCSLKIGKCSLVEIGPNF